MMSLWDKGRKEYLLSDYSKLKKQLNKTGSFFGCYSP